MQKIGKRNGFQWFIPKAIDFTCLFRKEIPCKPHRFRYIGWDDSQGACFLRICMIGFMGIMVILWPLGVWAEVSVQSTVDRTAMVEGDTFTLSIAVTSEKSLDIDEPRLPNLDQFELLNKWVSSQTQTSIGTGGVQTVRTQIFNYVLAPQKSGPQKIDSIEVVVSGKVYHTQLIHLNVLPEGKAPPSPHGSNLAQKFPSQRKGQGPQGPGHPRQQRGSRPFDPFTQMDEMFEDLFRGRSRLRTPPQSSYRNLFVRAEVDKSKVYVGEQITVSLYLYTTGHVRNIDTLKHPSNKGFWKEDINIATRLHFRNEVINGIAYRRALLASYALFPLKKGTAVIDPYKVKCMVIEGSTYGFGRPVEYTRASQAVNIEVMALPTENRPKDFSGAVGDFTVTSKLDGQNIPVNQPVTLTVRFRGKGNGKLIDLPPLTLPPSLEVYDTKKESKFFKNGQSYKEFEVLLIPRSPGSYVIPSMSVSAFNPQTGQYYQQKTKEYPLTVVPARGESIISASPFEGQKKKAQPQLPGVVVSWKSQGFWGAKHQIIFWIFIYLLVFGFLGWRFVVEFGLAQRKKDLRRLVYVKIQSVEGLIKKEDWRGVGTSVTNLVYRTLGEVSGLGGASVELEKLILTLPPSVRRELGTQIQRQNKTFEVLSFAPDEMLESLKNREHITKQVFAIEKTLLKAIDLGLGSGEAHEESSAGELVSS